jgi:hypothetical protein
MGTAQLAFEGVLLEVIACAITTGSCITGYDVTGSYITGSCITGNEREIISRGFPRVFFSELL